MVWDHKSLDVSGNLSDTWTKEKVKFNFMFTYKALFKSFSSVKHIVEKTVNIDITALIFVIG